MARPVKVWSQEEAESLLLKLQIKFRVANSMEPFVKLTGDADRKNQAGRDRYFAALLEQTRIAHAALMALRNGENLPAQLRSYIDTYLSPEGWKRIQNARRQHLHAQKTRFDEQVAKIDRSAGWKFEKLANAAGLSKKDYMSELATWLITMPLGEQAAQNFGAYLFMKAENAKARAKAAEKAAAAAAKKS